jgi:hypothetical protein
VRSEEYNLWFKIAFKEETDLLSRQIASNKKNGSSAVDNIVAELNQKYHLVNGEKLCKSTLYRAVRHSKAGESPMKRGTAPTIPEVLIDVVTLHTEVSQVGKGGELRGRDIKLLIGAAILGTKHDNTFKINSVWKKLRTRHPERLQVGTKVSMEEARL